MTYVSAPRWVDPSAAGNFDTRDMPLDVVAFRAVNRYVTSGTPVAQVGGLLVPYDATPATVTGAGVIVGHMIETGTRSTSRDPA